MAEYLPDVQVAANTATPAPNSASVVVDSVTKKLRTKDDAGAIVDYPTDVASKIFIYQNFGGL